VAAAQTKRSRRAESRHEARPLRLAFVGFGNVGRRFAELLGGPYGRILRGRGAAVVVTGIATGRHGLAIDPKGLPLGRCLARLRAGHDLAPFHRGKAVVGSRAFVRQVPADVLVELTPLDPRSGQPALDHVAAALGRGLHVITANKGPVAYGGRRLARLAARHGVRFFHEGVVMDGTPIFNLAERCLAGARILGFRGALNSTTTRILSRMEQGVGFAAALAEAQAAGVAEADPTNDLEGWDAAVKGCVLANALMGAALRPDAVPRTGITGIGAEEVQAARRDGRRYRLVVRGRREGRRGVAVSVAPEALPQDDLLVSSGADGVVVLQTDLMQEVGIWEGAGGIDQTAYGLLSDLLRLVESPRGTRPGR
jgi:homoserine dehydrogenase